MVVIAMEKGQVKVLTQRFDSNDDGFSACLVASQIQTRKVFSLM